MPFYCIKAISGRYGHWIEGERILPGIGPQRVPKEILAGWVEAGNVDYVAQQVEGDDNPLDDEEDEELDVTGHDIGETEDDGNPAEREIDPSNITDTSPKKRATAQFGKPGKPGTSKPKTPPAAPK